MALAPRDATRLSLRSWWALAAIALLLAHPALAAAQSDTPATPHLAAFPSATGFADATGGEGHAWFAVPTAEGAWLLHVPPRGGGANDGRVRVATHFLEMPLLLAARNDRAWALFAPEPATQGGDATQAVQTHRILEVAVSLSPSGDEWRTVNAQERPGVIESLVVAGRVAGLAGSSLGLVALVEDAEARSIQRVGPGGWESLALPEGVASITQAWRLMPSPQGIALARVEGRGSAMALRVRLAEGVRSPGDQGLVWKELRFSFDPLLDTWREDESAWSGAVIEGGAVVARRTSEKAWVVRRLDGGSDTVISRLELAPDLPVSGALLASSRRWVNLWSATPVAQPPPRSASAEETKRSKRINGPWVPARLSIQESSIDTGRELFRGPVALKGLADSREFRVLLGFIFAVSAVVLLFVLRPTETPRAFGLPPGLSLAPPERRWLAALLDFLPAAAASARVTGLWDASGIDTGAITTTILLAMLLSAGHCTLAEWIAGKSFGKALTGCEVVGVRFERHATGDDSGKRVELVPIVRRPRFWQALTRNLMRWLVPPLGIEGLGAGGGRHRADQAAGTAVVVRRIAQK